MRKGIVLLSAITLFASAVNAFTADMPKMDAELQRSQGARALVAEKEVTSQFNRLVSALNAKDTAAWAAFYSTDGFLSAIAGSQQYLNRAEWVQTITGYFALRASQHVAPLSVKVTVLSENLALLTSREKSVIRMKGGKEIKTVHAFTMLWKREPGGWHIIHSHESWMDEP